MKKVMIVLFLLTMSLWLSRSTEVGAAPSKPDRGYIVAEYNSSHLWCYDYTNHIGCPGYGDFPSYDNLNWVNVRSPYSSVLLVIDLCFTQRDEILCTPTYLSPNSWTTETLTEPTLYWDFAAMRVHIGSWENYDKILLPYNLFLPIQDEGGGFPE